MAIENLQPLTYAIISVAFALGTFSIFLRLYCRGILLKTFGLDDAVAVFLLVREIGRHITRLDSDTLLSSSMEASKLSYTCSYTMDAGSK
jgi:hypothetical protein